MSRLWIIVTIFSLLAVVVEAEPKIALRAVVALESDELRLSDFLPPDAPGTLRAQAAQVMLGRTPRPGSVRVIDRIELEHQLRPYLWSRRLSIPPRVTVSRLGYRLDPDPIRAAMESALQSQGAATKLGSLDMSAAPLVDSPAPPLQLLDVRYDALRQKWNARLVLANVPASPPFLVTASAPESVKPPRTGPAAPQVQPVLKVGQHAVLLLNDEGFRATIPVVCLQTGLPGVDIRVRDEVSGRIYRAQVAASGQIELAK